MAPTPTPTPTPVAGVGNPISGMVPDGSVFGTEFTTLWQRIFVGLWFVLIVFAVAALAMALAKLHKATANNIPGQADESRSHALFAGVALGALVGLGVIVGAIFTVAGG